jgi:nitrite reductase (NADH) small subunit
MGTWFRVLGPQECPPGRVLERIVAGRVVAVVHTQDGAWHALDGVCPHQGGPLGAGSLCGTTLTCPWHGWQFDVADGQHRLSVAVRQPTFPVEPRPDGVWVFLEPAPSGPVASG